MLLNAQQNTKVSNPLKLSEDSVIRIYTDGACSGNPGPGGWGALLEYGQHSKTIFGYELDTTNNRMEMRAIIESLKELKQASARRVEIYTDSKYAQQGITQWIHGWMKNSWRTAQNNPVKNCDLWRELYSMTQHYNNISWHWVKGHATNIGNNCADQLANQGKQEAIKVLQCR